MQRHFPIKLSLISLALVSLAGVALAHHPWGGYHWARTLNPFTLKLGNNTSGTWTGHLATAAADWGASSVLNTGVVPGLTKPKSCRPTNGRVEVCNANYGNNGWLGIAQIWITGGTHIYQGVVKNNDYYFNLPSYPYANEAEKLHVMCQEIGHTLGLDHQSEDGSSQNTCMDYYHNTSNADTLSTHPNAHDYEQLEMIYAHLDALTTVKASAGGRGNSTAAQDPDVDPSAWGREIRRDPKGRSSLFERRLGNGDTVRTLVIWAVE